jgi:hypothetical protein
MKNLIPVATFLFLSIFCTAQNTAPVVSITNIQADTSTFTITVTFDLVDAENDPLEVRASLSVDSGRTHLVGGIFATGDVGFPITPGANKSLTLTYDPDSIAALINNPGAWSTVRIVATDRKSPDVNQILAQIDVAQVMSDMQFLAIPRHQFSHPAGLELVKDSLEAIFNHHNLQAERLQFQLGSIDGENIRGRKSGIAAENRVVIIDGHFDGVPNTPGADDNATAVAAMLAAVRSMSGFHFNKTVQYIGFDKEELGLVGATHYVANHLNPREHIEGVINGEMIGYYTETPNSQSVPQGFNIIFPDVVDSLTANNNRGIFLFVIGNMQNSSHLSVYFDSVARHYVPQVRTLVLNPPGLGTIAPDLRRSDHAVFWDAGIPALMITDGADTRNPHYHQPTDVISTLDTAFLMRNIRAMVAVVSALAEPIYAGEAVSDAVQLALNLPLSLGRIHQMATFELFPNPADDQVYLRFPERVDGAEVRINSAGGRQILHTTVNGMAGEALSVGNLGHLSSGMYYVEVTVNGVRYHKKLILHEGHRH